MIENEEDQTEGAPEDDEAEEGDENFDGEGEGEDDGKKKKMIMIIGGVVLLLLIGGAAAFFTGALDSVLGKSASECVEEVDDHGEVVKSCPAEEHGDSGGDHGKKEKHAKKKGGGDHGGGGEHGSGANFLEIPTMIVNLNTENGTPRYLRLTVQLELGSAEDLAAVEGVIPRVVDQFQTYLRELRVRDLRGSAGIYRLQMELLWRVNQAAAPVEVKDVLFQEILIQ